MPEFFARLTDAQGSYATIKKDGTLGWANSTHAKAFDSAEDAHDQVLAAMKATLAKAHIELSRAKNLAKAQGGHICATHRGTKEDIIPQFFHYAPHWMLMATCLDENGQEAIDDARALKSFRIDSKAVLDDIMASFETFYARSAIGWLGGPRTKAMWGRFEWRESFTDAQGFPSQSALDEAMLLAGSTTGHSVLRSRSVFTEVRQNGNPRDDVAAGIGSACQARDIESTIVQAASSRLADLKSQSTSDAPSTTPKPRPRL